MVLHALSHITHLPNDDIIHYAITWLSEKWTCILVYHTHCCNIKARTNRQLPASLFRYHNTCIIIVNTIILIHSWLGNFASIKKIILVIQVCMKWFWFHNFLTASSPDHIGWILWEYFISAQGYHNQNYYYFYFTLTFVDANISSNLISYCITCFDAGKSMISRQISSTMLSHK